MAVVLAYRPDKNSELLLTCAITEAKTRQCPLTLINIAPDDALLQPGRLADGQAKDLQRRFDHDGIDGMVLQLPESPRTGEQIVETADDIGAELIVIGLRRRSRVGKLLLGSTAQFVLLHANCDVLAVRTQH